MIKKTAYRKVGAAWPLTTSSLIVLAFLTALMFSPIVGLVFILPLLVINVIALVRLVRECRGEDRRLVEEFKRAMDRPGYIAVMTAVDVEPDPVGLDPQWKSTVDRLRMRRREQAARMGELAGKVARSYEAKRTGVPHEAPLVAGLPGVEAELADWADEVIGYPSRELLTPARLSLRMQQASHQAARWVEVPRSEIVVLARPVRALCDCRYGHVGFHAIVGSRSDGGTVRECSECEPPTRWAERDASVADQASWAF